MVPHDQAFDLGGDAQPTMQCMLMRATCKNPRKDKNSSSQEVRADRVCCITQYCYLAPPKLLAPQAPMAHRKRRSATHEPLIINGATRLSPGSIPSKSPPAIHEHPGAMLPALPPSTPAAALQRQRRFPTTEGPQARH